jgi:hypothetical protein
MRLLLTFILFLFTATVVMAQDNPLKITFYGSFLHSEKVPNTLFFFSEIKWRSGNGSRCRSRREAAASSLLMLRQSSFGSGERAASLHRAAGERAAPKRNPGVDLI